jgi:hypothetical protein
MLTVEIGAFSNRSGAHLRGQDDQNGRKIMVLPSADMARLTRLLMSRKYISSSKQSSSNYELALFYKGRSSIFIM